jgi:hypothetical protein
MIVKIPTLATSSSEIANNKKFYSPNSRDVHNRMTTLGGKGSYLLAVTCVFFALLCLQNNAILCQQLAVKRNVDNWR